MWIINDQKAKAQTLLKYGIGNLLHQMDREDRKIDSIMSATSCSVGGMRSGHDAVLLDSCRCAKQRLGEARKLVNDCNRYISNLEVREWVDE